MFSTFITHTTAERYQVIRSNGGGVYTDLYILYTDFVLIFDEIVVHSCLLPHNLIVKTISSAHFFPFRPLVLTCFYNTQTP